MSIIEELKSLGVEGMFIGPHPSMNLRLLVKHNDNEVTTNEITERKFRKYFEYLMKIQSGVTPIPENFKVEVTSQKIVIHKYGILKNSIFELSQDDKVVLRRILHATRILNPKKVWENILQYGMGLNTEHYPTYLKEAYTYVCGISTVMKNDLETKKLVEERLNTDGLSLRRKNNLEFDQHAQLSRTVKNLQLTIKKELSNVMDLLKKTQQLLPSTLSDVQKNLLLVLDIVSEKSIESNRLSKKQYAKMKEVINQINDAGLELLVSSDEITKARVIIALFLKKTHPTKHISITNLNKLEKALQLEARRYYMSINGNKLGSKAMCDNIFRSARKAASKGYSDTYNDPIHSVFGKEKNRNSKI